MGSSCGSGAGRWCCPGAVIALGVWGACLWSVPGGGCFRAGECRLLPANNEIGGELTVEAVLRYLSGATFFRRVLEVVRSVRASRAMSNGTVIKDLLSVKFELPVWVQSGLGQDG